MLGRAECCGDVRGFLFPSPYQKYEGIFSPASSLRELGWAPGGKTPSCPDDGAPQSSSPLVPAEPPAACQPQFRSPAPRCSRRVPEFAACGFSLARPDPQYLSASPVLGVDARLLMTFSVGFRSHRRAVGFSVRSSFHLQLGLRDNL